MSACYNTKNVVSLLVKFIAAPAYNSHATPTDQ